MLVELYFDSEGWTLLRRDDMLEKVENYFKNGMNPVKTK